MSPKEKAQELIDKFNDVEDLKGRKIIYFIIDAKQCALIAVDEILEAIDWHELEFPNTLFEYWEEVKQEIEKP